MYNLELSIEQFSEKLKKYYSCNFSKLKIFNSEQMLNIDEYYLEPLIKHNNQSLDGKIFKFEKNIRYLLKGDIGIGKTTFVKYFCYRWALAREKEFLTYKLIIYLDLKYINKDTTEINDLIKAHYSGLINNLKLNFLLQEYKDEILFIFDGLDEVEDLYCQEKFYHINETIYSSVILTRINSFNINNLHIDNILKLEGIKDIHILKTIYNKNSLNSNDPIMKYIKKIFEEDDSLFRTLLFIRNDEYLSKMLQNPLFLILIKNNIQGLFKNRADDYTFYSKMIEDLILEYNKNTNIKNFDFDFTQYSHYRNENEKLKKFLINKLSYFAYDKEMLKSFETKEIQYILSLGFLKTSQHRRTKENAKYIFINEIFHKYFLAHYIANLGLQEFKKELEKIDKEEIDIFAFLNILLDSKLEQYSILIKHFSNIVRGLDKEKQILIIARTQIEIDHLAEEVQTYEQYVEDKIDSNIDKKSLIYKISQITTKKTRKNILYYRKNSKGLGT